MPEDINISKEMKKRGLGTNLTSLLFNSVPHEFIMHDPAFKDDARDENGDIIWSVELKVNGKDADVEKFANHLVSQLHELVEKGSQAILEARIEAKMSPINDRLETIRKGLDDLLKLELGITKVDREDY